MDVSGGSTADGALVIQWPCHGGDNQSVTITDKGGGWHEIRFKHSNKCLDLPAFNPNDGVQFQQWACQPAVNPAQRFTVACTGCTGTMQNQSSGKCVDVAGSGNGTEIIQWTCYGYPWQQWLLRDTYAVGLAPATGNWAQSIPPGAANPDPAVHHLVSCEPFAWGSYEQYFTEGFCNGGSYPDGPAGDWAMDYYAVEGSQVKFQAFGVGSQGANVTAQVWAITRTCSAYPRNQGGSTVFVNVYTNGWWEGWIAYGHLNNVAVQPLQWITPGTALGTTKWWTGVGGCYQVGTPGGVHAHLEMYNQNYAGFSDGYACYIPYSYYQSMNSTFPLGYVGRTVYGGLRSQC